MTLIIHWFRRDLRLYDNTALAAAARASGGAVVPLFILDEKLTAPQGRFTSPARVHFLLESLRALDIALREQNSHLVLRRGNPHDELLQLAAETDATAVYWNRDYSPYAHQRDKAIAAALQAAGHNVQTWKDAVIWEGEEILTKADKPYTVYTPYARQWHQRLHTEGISLADVPTFTLPPERLPATTSIPDLADLGLMTTQRLPTGGEVAAQELLQSFTDRRRRENITGYDIHRDQLALDGTSRLSAHLRLGTISPRVCVWAAQETAQQAAQKEDASADGPQVWVGELAWRDFYIQILANYPHVLRGAFKQQYDVLEWENDPEFFAAWCAGGTGYPVVDAAMRQLNQEAWMHNRGRMIVASFLTKDLLVDWRWGERYFMQQLVDGDPAANNGGWQWAAGTGTDAQPYFRIFNPISQGKKFDPDGSYVRRYIPELSNVPTRYIHEPWKLAEADQRRAGVAMGHDYPLPIVDHSERRKRALELYKAVR